jgi:hypothetical protein
MQVVKIDKKLQVTRLDLHRFHLLNELCFRRKEMLIESDLMYMSLLSMWGVSELSSFCDKVSLFLFPDVKPEQLPKRAQNVRNRVVKLQKRGFLIKEKSDRNYICVHNDLILPVEKDMLLNYQVLHIEPTKD